MKKELKAILADIIILIAAMALVIAGGEALIRSHYPAGAPAWMYISALCLMTAVIVIADKWSWYFIFSKIFEKFRHIFSERFL